MSVSIALDGLSIGYGQHTIAKNISYEFLKGELIAVVGVNGIGKSTLLRSITKLQPILDGMVAVVGNPIEHLNPTELSKLMALVLTEPLATKNLTVEELLALGRQPYTNWLGTLAKSDISKIELGISQFNLAGIRTKKCFELSDGQLQRVLIARAMIQDTPLIVLDEPTTHLDLQNKVQILKLLQQLAHKHEKTVVFSTHEIDLAIQLCDKILILDGDENPFGTPAELIKKGSFEKLFQSETVRFDAKTRTFKIIK
jgi:iron complex transport system ATP-binding protein